RLGRTLEGVGVLVAMNFSHRRLAARLEDRDQSAAGVLRGDRGDRLAHRGRVVGEVVDDGDAFQLSLQLLSPLDAAAALEAGRDLVWLEPERAARGVDAEGVLDVVAAGGGERHADLGPALVVDLERRAGGAEVDPTRVPVGLDFLARAVGFDLALRG